MLKRRMKLKPCFWFAAMFFLAVYSATGATISVDASCSLVDAVISANTNTATGGCSAGDANVRDEIILEPAATYSLTTPVYTGSDGDTALPSIVSDIRIIGNGSTIQRVVPDLSPPYFRLIHVAESGDLILENTILTGGLTRWYSTMESRKSNGAAIFNRGTTSIIGSTITDNSSHVFGGGVFNMSGALSIQSTDIKDNYGESGGGIYLKTGSVDIRGSSISGNDVDADGGGVFVGSAILKLDESVLDNNEIVYGGGGGLFNESGNVTVTWTSISRNKVANNGAGIANINGIMEIRHSAIYANSANTLEQSSASGGGLANENIMSISNTTISGNYTDGSGSAIENEGELSLVNITVSENESNYSQGALRNHSHRGHIEIVNSIVANNISHACEANTSTSTRLIDLGHNWFDDTSCNGVDRGNPRLRPLADNGGHTFTHALADNSGAIDGGDHAICLSAPINNKDQRGINRNQGRRCDIGAYELTQSEQTTIMPIYDLILGQ